MNYESIYCVSPGTNMIVRFLLQVDNGSNPSNTYLITIEQNVYECCEYPPERLLHPSIGQSFQVSSRATYGGKIYIVSRFQRKDSGQWRRTRQIRRLGAISQ